MANPNGQLCHKQEVKSRQVEVFVGLHVYGVDLCQCCPRQLGWWGGRSESLSCLKIWRDAPGCSGTALAATVMPRECRRYNTSVMMV
jgi:hypothetical protein